MIKTIGRWLNKLAHTSGGLLYLQAQVVKTRASLWIGRENPDQIKFSVELSFDYGDPNMGGRFFNARVEIGVVVIEVIVDPVVN